MKRPGSGSRCRPRGYEPSKWRTPLYQTQGRIAYFLFCFNFLRFSY